MPRVGGGRQGATKAALLWALVLVLPAHLVASVTEKQVFEGRAQVIALDWDAKPITKTVAVRTSATKKVHLKGLNVKKLFEGIKTGNAVKASGVYLSNGAATPSAAAAANLTADSVFCFNVSSLEVVGPGRARTGPRYSEERPLDPHPAAGAPTPAVVSNALVERDLSVLFIPISGRAANGSLCPSTKEPLFTVQQVRRAVFQELNPSAITVGSTFNRCSYNRSRLTAANSRFANMVVLPCGGEIEGVPWEWDTCDFDDFNGYADAADAVLRKHGVPIEQYKYRVYMLPPCKCTFLGLGYLGCEEGMECRSWIAGSHWTTPAAIVHELGHNLFLQHAGTLDPQGKFDEYGDSSSYMGGCCMDRCPNTPHAWQMGWLSLTQLDGDSLRPGQTRPLRLSAQPTAAAAGPGGSAGVRINATWVPAVPEAIFVGYRTRSGGDVALAASMVNRVIVYQSASVNTFDAQYSKRRAALGAGQAWTHAESGVVVRVRSVGAAAAELTVCRKSASGKEDAASCKAGLDNDCNGKVGKDESACAAFLATGRHSLA